jgi:hypothetical protein
MAAQPREDYERIQTQFLKSLADAATQAATGVPASMAIGGAQKIAQGGQSGQVVRSNPLEDYMMFLGVGSLLTGIGKTAGKEGLATIMSKSGAKLTAKEAEALAAAEADLMGTGFDQTAMEATQGITQGKGGMPFDINKALAVGPGGRPMTPEEIAHLPMYQRIDILGMELGSQTPEQILKTAMQPGAAAVTAAGGPLKTIMGSFAKQNPLVQFAIIDGVVGVARDELDKFFGATFPFDENNIRWMESQYAEIADPVEAAALREQMRNYLQTHKIDTNPNLPNAPGTLRLRLADQERAHTQLMIKSVPANIMKQYSDLNYTPLEAAKQYRTDMENEMQASQKAAADAAAATEAAKPRYGQPPQGATNDYLSQAGKAMNMVQNVGPEYTPGNKVSQGAYEVGKTAATVTLPPGSKPITTPDNLLPTTTNTPLTQTPLGTTPTPLTEEEIQALQKGKIKLKKNIGGI